MSAKRQVGLVTGRPRQGQAFWHPLGLGFRVSPKTLPLFFFSSYVARSIAPSAMKSGRMKLDDSCILAVHMKYE